MVLPWRSGVTGDWDPNDAPGPAPTSTTPRVQPVGEISGNSFFDPNTFDEAVSEGVRVGDWWANNSQLQEADRWLGSDDSPEGTHYRRLLYNASTNGWSDQRVYQYAEEHGLIGWANQRLSEMPGAPGSGDPGGGGRRGFRGGGGGGGGGGPAVSREDQMTQVQARLQNLASSMGITLTPDELTWYGTAILDRGFTEDAIVDSMLKDLAWGDRVKGGTLTAAIDDIKALSNAFLIDVSEATARDYSIKINSGEMTMEGLRTLLAEQARNEYGWMSSVIDSGITPRDFLLPARDRIASTLELNPEDLDMRDKGLQAMMTVTDPETKQTRAATLTEVEYSARRDSRYANTRQVQDLTASMGTMLDDLFGGRS